MRLTFGDLLQGSQLATIFSKSKAQACRGGDLGQRIDRNSVDLHKTRLVTRKCSLENSNHGTSPQAHVEELHCVIPRQDSIMLAKRRLSHDVQAAAAAPDRLPTRTADAAGDDNNWNIPSQQQQHAATTA